MKTITRLTIFLLPAAAFAHHSSVGIYDPNAIIEVEGTLEQILWRNPHVQLQITSNDGSRGREHWVVEGASVSILSRKGVSETDLRIGDRIRVAGTPAVRDVNEMYMTNILLQDGREVMMLPRGEPRWSDDAVLWSSWSELTDGAVEDAVRAAQGVFRVWTTDFSTLDRRLWNDDYPLTEAALAARESWDPVDSVYRSCIKGMPSIMEQPYPIEFVERGRDIVLRIEEYDVVRVIRMDAQAADDPRPPAPWGNSVGMWDGETLVVTTTGVDWPYFDQTGIPLNESTLLVERFTPADAGRRLDYSVTVTDPQIFTEPVTLSRQWVWRPGEQVKPFDCTAARVSD